MGMFDDLMWDDRHEEEEEEDIVLIRCSLIHQTAKGYLIRRPTSKGYREAWFPKRYSTWYPDEAVFCYEPWLLPNWTLTHL